MTQEKELKNMNTPEGNEAAADEVKDMTVAGKK